MAKRSHSSPIFSKQGGSPLLTPPLRSLTGWNAFSWQFRLVSVHLHLMHLAVVLQAGRTGLHDDDEGCVHSQEAVQLSASTNSGIAYNTIFSMTSLA